LPQAKFPDARRRANVTCDPGKSPNAYSISSIQQVHENPREHHDSDVDHKDKQEKRAKSQIM
jgi:hypothetical protein